MNLQKPDYSAERTAAKRSRERDERDFRSAVWSRDKGRDRSTGDIVFKGSGHWEIDGQVCHLRSRGAYPELATDPHNAVLMSGLSHWLSDSRGGHLLRLTDPDTGEPAINGSVPIRFTLYDRQGTVRWTRVR